MVQWVGSRAGGGGGAAENGGQRGRPRGGDVGARGKSASGGIRGWRIMGKGERRGGELEAKWVGVS